MSIQLQKQQLRTSIKSIIKCFPFDSIISSSSSLTQRLFNLPELNSTSKNISIYLPLPIGEINTIEFINRFMKERGDNSLCYIPKVYGKKSTDMTMYYLSEKDLVKSPTPLSSAFLENVNFPLNSWGIPEPDLEQVLQQQQVTSTTDLKIPSDIDIVIVPGVGFDLKGMRLGHGKGYYGKYYIILLSLPFFLLLFFIYFL